MKNLLVLAFSFFSLSGFSFTTLSVFETQSSTTVKTTSPVQQMFTYLRVHRQGKGVSVNWGIATASGVANFKIERSYDGEFFDPICQTPCNGSMKYTYNDGDIFPGYIYYRIKCTMNDGTSCYSAVDVVRIVQHG
jgi:hypothetical protein